MTIKKLMKKLLYTFFFGYAAFKWRRLIRTLICLYFIYPLLILFWGYGDGVLILITGLLPILVIPLISWVIKSFIVKEDK